MKLATIARFVGCIFALGFYGVTLRLTSKKRAIA